MKILIVDDNEPYRKLLSAIFTDRGWEALDAPDGTRGMELLREQIPDVILSDIMMPRMDGFQFLRALRTSAFGDIIFIFYTSTYTKTSHRDFALALGADAYIAKPLDPEAIVQVLMGILDRKGLRPERRELPSEEEFLRLHSLFLSEKLMEKAEELRKESVEHRRIEDELMHLREKERQRPGGYALGQETVGQGFPTVSPQSVLSVEIDDEVYTPLNRAEALCRSIAEAGLPDSEGYRLVEKICLSIGKLRNLVMELARNFLLPRSAVLAPIRRIQIMMDVLKKDYAAFSATLGSRLEEMEGLLRQFAGFVEDLLKLGNVAKQTLKNEPVDITGLAGEILAGLRQSSPHRRCEFSIQPGLNAVGDHLLLRTALEQLLENAWKYTVARDETRITVGSRIEGGKKPEYYVSDNGIGFPAEKAGSIFKAFGKAHEPPGVAGNGIGLTLAKAIVRRHGGDIRCEAEAGRGATFFFTI
ncbi:response regulator [Geotalea sp. SG265]|uniref:response regulator n=1 Tax=Geotalea sp. SG265 TaxID=2922867 RepID=UPI001FAEF664|nr:response regulator [Geotalea sp. SG265]